MVGYVDGIEGFLAILELCHGNAKRGNGRVEGVDNGISWI